MRIDAQRVAVPVADDRKTEAFFLRLQPVKAFDLAQDFSGSGDNPLPGGCYAGQMLTAAGEDLDAKFILE